jgi:hypothetical protein
MTVFEDYFGIFDRNGMTRGILFLKIIYKKSIPPIGYNL